MDDQTTPCPCGNPNCSQEAIPARCPLWQLPGDGSSGSRSPTKLRMTDEERRAWKLMVNFRPNLAYLEEIEI